MDGRSGNGRVALRLAGLLIIGVLAAPAAGLAAPGGVVGRPRMRRRAGASQPCRDHGARSAAARPADLRHAVQAGGAQRRLLRDLSPQDRVHAADATCCRTWRAGGRTSSCSTRTSGSRRWGSDRAGRWRADVIAHRGGPQCDAVAEPCGALGAISALTTAYGRTVARTRRGCAASPGCPRCSSPRPTRRPRFHRHVLEPRQALRDLPDRLRRSAAVRAVARPPRIGARSPTRISIRRRRRCTSRPRRRSTTRCSCGGRGTCAAAGRTCCATSSRRTARCR